MNTPAGSSSSAAQNQTRRRIEPIFDASGALRQMRDKEDRSDVSAVRPRDTA